MNTCRVPCNTKPCVFSPCLTCPARLCSDRLLNLVSSVLLAVSVSFSLRPVSLARLCNPLPSSLAYVSHSLQLLAAVPVSFLLSLFFSRFHPTFSPVCSRVAATHFCRGRASVWCRAGWPRSQAGRQEPCTLSEPLESKREERKSGYSHTSLLWVLSANASVALACVKESLSC